MSKVRPERVAKLLKQLGFSFVRDGGRHFIYEGKDGVRLSIAKSPPSEVYLNSKQLKRIIAQKRRVQK